MEEFGETRIYDFVVEAIKSLIVFWISVLVWECGHGFRARDLHVNAVEVRYAGKAGGFVRTYDHAGGGKLTAYEIADIDDGDRTCSVVYDEDGGRLAVVIREAYGEARTKRNKLANDAGEVDEHGSED